MTAAPHAGADRNLLFGMLALQMDFIGRDALIEAMQAWVFQKDKAVGAILVEQGALTAERQSLLEALVQEHLKQHGNDAERSLAAIGPSGMVSAELQRIADPELQASLATVSGPPLLLQADQDPHAGSLGTPTSSCQRFRILRPHARGGLGEIFVAMDEELRREVALKQIQERHADHFENRARFLLEAEITGTLEHPGIVPIYGLGRDANGRPFYAMRFIRGESLKETIARFHAGETAGQDPGVRAVELHQLLGRLVAVCQTVAYAHNRGVLHRDLKPSNIMLGQYGETLIVDWGLAKVMDGSAETAAGEPLLFTLSGSDSGLTQAGSTLGTPAYISPEQALGRMELLSPASDVYSLGATLYHLLTGQAPFNDAEPALVLSKVQTGNFPRPRQVNPRVPAALEAICLRAMALRPEDRYPAARALADDLEHWLADEPVTAYPLPAAARLGRWLRRHKGPVGVAAVGCALVATVAVAWGLVAAAVQRAEKQAQVAAEMDRLRGVADTQHAEADWQRVRAEEQEALARHYLYSSRMNMAGIAWHEAQIARMQELLDQERPGAADQADLRGFEWYYLWRLRQSHQHTINAHPRGVHGLALSPDGTRLASGSAGYANLDMPGEVKVWDMASGRELFYFQRFASHVVALAFSPDGSRLATGCGNDRRLRLWNLTTGQEEAAIDTNAPQVVSIAFSPDGRRLVSASGAKVSIWDPTSRRELLTLDAHAAGVGRVAFSPDGQRLAGASGDGTVTIWDAADGREVRVLAGHKGAVTGVAFSPAGKYLASASADGTGRLWDLSTGVAGLTFLGHASSLTDVAFSPDGQRLATASVDQTLKVWEVGSGREVLTLRGHIGPVNRVVFSRDGSSLASVAADGKVKIWNPLTPQEATVLAMPPGTAQRVAFGPAGRLATTPPVKIWDLATGREALVLQGDTSRVNQVAFSPEGRRLAGGGIQGDAGKGPAPGGQVRLWDLTTGEVIATLRGHRLPVTAVAFSPDGKRLVSVSGTGAHRDSPGEVKLWDLDRGQELAAFAGHPNGIQAVAFSPDGRHVASAGFDRIVRVWDTASGQEVLALSGHSKTLYAVAYSPDGRTIASASSDETVRLWDAATGRALHSIRGHTRHITGLSFSPDGKRLASVSWDGTVKLWDPATGQETLTLKGHPGALWSVAFSPDGRRLASAGDGTIRIWDATPIDAPGARARTAEGK